jgi:hypothetical protein
MRTPFSARRGQAAVEGTRFPARRLRGQAAVEYLMTYGWVVLALVIVIGVLFSTGIFSPNYMAADECNFGNNLKCSATLFNEGGHTKIIMNVFNGFPYGVKVTGVALSTQDGKQQFVGFDSGMNISSGENVSFRADITPAFPEGSVKRFVGNLTYVSCAPELGTECSSVEHLASGRVTSSIISAD